MPPGLPGYIFKNVLCAEVIKKSRLIINAKIQDNGTLKKAGGTAEKGPV